MDDNRVRLTPEPGVAGSDYINASPVRGFTHDREFIITQFPLLDKEVQVRQQSASVSGAPGDAAAVRSTVADFWHMLFMYRLGLVVVFAGERLHDHKSTHASAFDQLDVHEWLRESLAMEPSEELELKLLNTGVGIGSVCTPASAGSPDSAGQQPRPPTPVAPTNEPTMASRPPMASSRSRSTTPLHETPTGNVAAVATALSDVSGAGANANGSLAATGTPVSRQSAEDTNENASKDRCGPSTSTSTPPGASAHWSLQSDRFSLLQFELKSIAQHRSMHTLVLVVLEPWPDVYVRSSAATATLPTLNPNFFDIFLLTRCENNSFCIAFAVLLNFNILIYCSFMKIKERPVGLPN